MTRLVASGTSALFLAVLLLVGNAHGQYVSRAIKVSVPFTFDVGDKTFPAGDYSVLQTAPYLLSLRDVQGHVLANLLTGSVERAESHGPAKLDFYVDGDRHVLARVWQEHELLGHQVSPSKRSTYLAKRRNTRIQAAAEGSQP